MQGSNEAVVSNMDPKEQGSSWKDTHNKDTQFMETAIVFLINIISALSLPHVNPKPPFKGALQLPLKGPLIYGFSYMSSSPGRWGVSRPPGADGEAQLALSFRLGQVPWPQ